MENITTIVAIIDVLAGFFIIRSRGSFTLKGMTIDIRYFAIIPLVNAALLFV